MGHRASPMRRSSERQTKPNIDQSCSSLFYVDVIYWSGNVLCRFVLYLGEGRAQLGGEAQTGGSFFQMKLHKHSWAVWETSANHLNSKQKYAETAKQ